LAKEDFSYDADREIVRKLYKTFIDGNEDFDSLLEDHGLYWNDDKFLIDSFVLKTIKKFNPEAGAGQPLLPQFSMEEDREFASALFRETIKRKEDIKELISQNCKNWEYDRLAFMDVIIMQIAITEILTFPSIPLSVTFNEYLDIAKVYSTPRSASYINGLMDHVVKRLKAEGKLMKA
jgi:N utilization substance protein B